MSAGRLSLRRLEALLIDDPRADDLADAYGAVLRELGDVRGDLIALDAALAAAPARARAHLERDRLALFRDCGPVLAPASIIEMAARAPSPSGGLEVSLGKRSWLRWGRGLIRAAHIDVADCPGGRLQVVIDDLLAHPAAMVLEDLRIAPAPIHGVSYPDIIAALADLAPPLRRFEYGVLGAPAPIGRFELGDLRSLWPALPRLRGLLVEGDAPVLGTVDLVELRELSIRGRVGSPALVDLGRSPLPSLERVEIAAIDPPSPRALAELIDGFGRRPITDLSLAGLDLFNPRALDRLCDSPLLAGLESLALGDVDDRAAAALVDRAPAFAHLDRLELAGDELGDAGRSALEVLAAVVGELVVR